MAKVTGPLFSMSASGSIGKAITFSIWKGIAYVRELVIPLNKKTEDQGDNRLILGGLAKSIAPIVGPTIVAPQGGDFYARIAPHVPAGQSWASFAVQKMYKDIIQDATGFEAVITAVDGHSATSDWAAGAADASLFAFDISYKGTASVFSAKAQLYMLAKLGFALNFTTAPFATALGSWTSTQIDALVTELSHVTA